MPVYVASRPLQSLAGLAAEHQYLVYVPAGEEDNYSTWKTIGAFPAGTGLDGLGSGSLLVGSSGGVSTIGVPLDQTPDNWSNSAVDDYRAEFPNYTDVEIGENLFHFTEIYSGIDESTVWDGLVSIANGLDGDYTYKVIDVYGATNNVVFGPTTNSNSFVSSVLRLAAIDGYSISEFTTSAITPGYATLLGTSNNDTLSATDANIDGGDFAAIYGGDGADVLTGGSSSIYLIGGKDDQVDILKDGNFCVLPRSFPAICRDVRGNLRDCSSVQHWRCLIHIPNMENVSVGSLNCLVPFIACHNEAHGRDRSGFDFNEPVRNAALAVIVGKHVVTCKVVIKTWPFRFPVNTDVFEALALMFQRKDFCSASLLHFFVICEQACIA